MTAQPWLESARTVLAQHGFRTVDPVTGTPVETEWGAEDDQGIEEVVNDNAVILDLVTAGMLVQIYDALSPRNQEKFGNMPLLQAVDVGWKLVTRAKEKS